MAELGLSYDIFLDAIAEDAERFSNAISGNLEKSVASCPPWNGADLLAHLTNVYRRWTAQVLAKRPEERTVIEEKRGADEEELAAFFDQSAADLLEALGAAGDESPAWNMTGEDLVTSWVARRVTHETAIHRVDAELLDQHVTQIERELAADGLTERIVDHLPTRIAKEANLGGTIALICDDIETAFVIEVNDGVLRYRSQRGPADCVVVGSASELFMFSWNRLSPSELSVTGDRDVAAAWSTIQA